METGCTVMIMISCVFCSFLIYCWSVLFVCSWFLVCYHCEYYYHYHYDSCLCYCHDVIIMISNIIIISSSNNMFRYIISIIWCIALSGHIKSGIFELTYTVLCIYTYIYIYVYIYIYIYTHILTHIYYINIHVLSTHICCIVSRSGGGPDGG